MSYDDFHKIVLNRLGELKHTIDAFNTATKQLQTRLNVLEGKEKADMSKTIDINLRKIKEFEDLFNINLEWESRINLILRGVML